MYSHDFERNLVVFDATQRNQICGADPSVVLSNSIRRLVTKYLFFISIREWHSHSSER